MDSLHSTKIVFCGPSAMTLYTIDRPTVKLVTMQFTGMGNALRYATALLRFILLFESFGGFVFCLFVLLDNPYQSEFSTSIGNIFFLNYK